MTLDPRTLRRAALRATLGVLLALLPSLLTRRFVATPPCVAFMLAPFTLVELGGERRATRLFLVATVLCGAGLVNGVYLEGVYYGGSIEAGLEAVAAYAGVTTNGQVVAVAMLVTAAQTIGLGYTIAAEMIPVDGTDELDPIVFGPTLVGVEVAVLMLLEKPRVAPAAGLVFVLIATAGSFAVALAARGVCLAADAAERRLFPEPAR